MESGGNCLQPLPPGVCACEGYIYKKMPISLFTLLRAAEPKDDNNDVQLYKANNIAKKRYLNV